jgi:cardiolipin synthase
MGLCVGRDWVGRPEKNIEPWRDTGVEIRGPAVADMEAAFARVWETACGEKIPREDLPEHESIAQGGDVAVRVIATEPNTVGLYRLEQLVAAGARKYLWLTDAYFVGTTMYVQALRAAAQDGVDVRLLVPSASDIPVVSALSRANYRALLEAGVRVFECLRDVSVYRRVPSGSTTSGVDRCHAKQVGHASEQQRAMSAVENRSRDDAGEVFVSS